MAKKKETGFKERVLRDLRALPRTWCEKIQQVALRGTPDVLVCMNSHFVALELKKDAKAKIDDLQIHKLGLIADAGGSALIVFPENWEVTLEALVNEFLRDVPAEEWQNAKH